jgi:Acetyltransferase (GNAT) domain
MSELSADFDVQLYTSITNEFVPEDRVDVSKLQQRIGNGEMRAWFAYKDDTLVGWCALSNPSPFLLAPSIHLYGNVVGIPYRSLGYGREMFEFRLALYPQAAFSVSIKNGHAISERLATQHGFSPVGTYRHWRIWSTCPKETFIKKNI